MSPCFICSSLVFFLTANAVRGQLLVQPPGSVFTSALGSSMVFTCQMTGVDPVGIIVNIQWMNQQGLEILGTTPGRDGLPYIDKSVALQNKLYIMGIDQTDAGNYSCQAVLAGNLEQINITLNIFQDITFVNAPALQNPIIYTNALILCQVTGNPIPDVYWKYAGQRLTSSRYIQDVYGLRITNITLNDDGLYDCCAEIVAKGELVIQQINVIVYIPPNITAGSPGTQYGISSQQFAFSCNATGLPSPKYVFYRGSDLNQVVSTSRIQVDGDAGLIEFRPLQADDQDYYTCNAFNSVGQASSEGYLRVYVPPTIYSVKNVTQTEGLTTTLICLSYGNPAPDMTYRKEGLTYDYTMGPNVGGRITLANPSPGDLEMTITNLEPDDMGNYTCKSRNIAGYHEKNGTITVQYAPLFHVDNPTVFYNWAGKTRNLTCQVLAEPMPVIDWIRRGQILQNNETFRIYIMGKNSNLQVTVREVDQGYIFGNYTCRARNQLGEAELNIAMLQAKLPGPPTNVSATVTPTTIDLHLYPPTDLGGSQLLGYWVQHQLTVQEFILGDDYLIEYLLPSNAYALLIRARTEVGLGTTLTYVVQTLDIQVPYPIVINSSPVGTWPYQYLVTWQVPETGGLPIREYEFRMLQVNVQPGTLNMTSAVGDFARRVKDLSVGEVLLYYLIQGLQPSSYYQLSIRAMNDIGYSNPNPTFIFSTTADMSLGGLTGSALKLSSFNLTFYAVFSFLVLFFLLLSSRHISL